MDAKPIALIAVAMIIFTDPAAVIAKAKEFDRFRLWADCLPMSLVVEDNWSDSPNFRLTSDAIETAVRSRLRAARIYNTTQYAGLLIVNVNVVRHDTLQRDHGRQPFNVTVQYHKLMKDVLSGERMLAVAREASTAGIGEPSLVLSTVSR